jgi:hypothetical protein
MHHRVDALTNAKEHMQHKIPVIISKVNERLVLLRLAHDFSLTFRLVHEVIHLLSIPCPIIIEGSPLPVFEL